MNLAGSQGACFTTASARNLWRMMLLVRMKWAKAKQMHDLSFMASTLDKSLVVPSRTKRCIDWLLTSAVPVAAACGAIERGGAQLSLKPGVLSQYFLIRCFKCWDSKLILNRPPVEWRWVLMGSSELWELHELLASNGRSEQRFPAESGATAWPLGLDFPYCCQWQGGSQKNGVTLLPLCHHQKDSENTLETGTLRGTSCPHLFAGSYDSPRGSWGED